MTLEDMLKLIALKCGNREFEDMEEFALPYFAVKQAELESDPFLPWFLRSEALLPVVDGEVALPEDFLKLDNSSGQWYTEGAGSLSELCVLDQKSALDKYGLGSGVPVAGVLRNNSFVLYPMADSGMVTLGYYAKAAPLVNMDDTNSWATHAPWYLLASVGIEVAEDLEHGPGVRFFKDKKEYARELLFRGDVEREAAGQVFRW